MSNEATSLEDLQKKYNQSIENIKLICMDQNGRVDIDRLKQSIVNLWYFHFLPQNPDLDRFTINKIRHLFDKKVYDIVSGPFCVELAQGYRPYPRKLRTA